MAAQLRHMSINADDVERAKAFYERVFGWTFRAWGPPGFYLTDDAGVGLARPGRAPTTPVLVGAEVTMAVDDLAAVTTAIEAAGGVNTGRPYDIPTVGSLTWFEDTEGNRFGAMRYLETDPTPRPAAGATNVMRWFAINADDVARAKAFYERVFGWTFEPWGPPDFYVVRNAGATFNGGLQGRRELKPGVPTRGLEISFGVADIGAFVRALEAAGGRMAMQPVKVGGVGTLGYFADTEGNVIGVCQYENLAEFG